MLVCVSLPNLARETAGAARTRLSLRPLFDEGGKKKQIPGATRRGIAKVYPPSLRAQRSNPAFFLLRHGLLRCARNDGF
jgi:hypothetical protein